MEEYGPTRHKPIDPAPDPDRFRRLTAEYMETRFPELWEALERMEDVDS